MHLGEREAVVDTEVSWNPEQIRRLRLASELTSGSWLKSLDSSRSSQSLAFSLWNSVLLLLVVWYFKWHGAYLKRNKNECSNEQWYQHLLISSCTLTWGQSSYYIFYRVRKEIPPSFLVCWQSWERPKQVPSRCWKPASFPFYLETLQH